MVVDPIRQEDGTLLGFAKITRDITEQRNAQEALKESERRFRMLVEGVTDYALYMLDPNGIITNWNTGVERIKGYKAAEIVGNHFSRFYTEGERAAGLPARALQIAGSVGRYEAEGQRLRKDGTTFWASVVIDAIRDEEGRLVGFAKITRDVTERRLSQLALEQAQIERAHAQKMEALGQLTGGVAHDFNNLLMIIGGNLHLLRKYLADDPKAREAVEAIELAAKRGESLTRQLLTFSRRQALNPATLQLADRFPAIRTLLASTVPASVRLSFSIQPGLWPVKIDVSEFELALVNIAVNARDAMPGGGTLSLTATNETLAASETPQRLEGNFVAIRMADSGSGIPADLLPKVFDPFFTTKPADKGTGLGLSQVHGFAHLSGGTVLLRSTMGIGTTITLYLPRSLDEPEQEGLPEKITTGKGGRALLMEDNDEVAQVTGRMLEQLGYEVHTVPAALAGLEAVERMNFDLVVSDIVVPGEMDGLSFAHALRQRHPALPILLVTGYSANAGQAEGDFHVLRKPYLMSGLGQAIDVVLRDTGKSGGNLVPLRPKGGRRDPR